MRQAGWWVVAGWLLMMSAAQAVDSLRVGNRVLVVGDSAATVAALLGKPTYKSHARATSSRSRKQRSTRAVSTNAEPGERWQYRHDGRVIVVTLVDGRVADIDDHVR